MIYADTDYLLALAKDEDWLKDDALKLQLKSGELETSAVALVELLFYAKEKNIDAERLVLDVRGLVSNIKPITFTTVLTAANYMKKHGLNPGDALHLASIGKEEELITSDGKLQKIGKELGFKVRKLKP